MKTIGLIWITLPLAICIMIYSGGSLLGMIQEAPAAAVVIGLVVLYAMNRAKDQDRELTVASSNGASRP